jgi:hypothetical protein
LPLQQPRTADAFGKFRQLIAKLGRHARELWTIGCGGHQHQIPKHTRESLQDGTWIPASVQQVAGGFQQGYGL